tara:strand:- start:903 stop:2402 length:1500 start_codon:yes stop_codon:yes gene_type:complete
MNPNPSRIPWPAIGIAGGLAGVLIAIATFSIWWPSLSNWVDATLASQRSGGAAAAQGHDDHTGHDHGAEDTAEASLVLSQQARRNLGLTEEFLRPVELSTYRRSITVPAIVVPKPGRSSIIVSSPLNGVITHVHAVTGEAVMPGDLLFEVRLTYEDLVETQTAYLKTISEIEVENREIARLEDVTRSGAVSGKLLLERRYAKEKLEAFAKSQREALRMHGLNERQVEEIGENGKLLHHLKIVAPDVDTHEHDDELQLTQVSTRSASFSQLPPLATPRPGQHETGHDPLVIDDLLIHKGQAIVAGERLCSLSDYSQLFIEGKAFENDVAAISEAAKRGWRVDAVFSSSSGQTMVNGLELAYVSNSIDLQSRTLSLFVELPNEIIRDESNDDGQRFLTWKYRVGQRLELRVPVEQWDQQIVLPVDAVVESGADWFVFVQNGRNFSRVPVHVRYRDQNSVVIANDGSIYPGDVVAMKSAHRMQMAISNKSGGAVDPHAGHNH